MEKQLNSSPGIKPSEKKDLIKCFINEIQNHSSKKLSLTLKKLNYLAANFDPYHGVDIDINGGLNNRLNNELLNILNDFKLKEYVADPFKFTNILLQLLDLTQEETKKRKH